MVEQIRKLKGLLPYWLNESGPYSDIVINTKVSLYRSVNGYNYSPRMKEKVKKELLEYLTSGIETTGDFKEVIPLNTLSDFEKEFIFERNFISSKEMYNGSFQAVVFNNKQSNILVLNSLEHLRISSISPGLNILEPFNECDRMDDELNDEFDFIFDDELGFLNSSPTKIGTGMEVSCLIHLPAVVITGQAGDLIENLERESFKMEGTFNIGGGVEGSLFRIITLFSLGLCEQEIISKTEEKIKEVIQNEINAREYLMDNARFETEDKIWRSYGILMNARFLNLEDFLNLSSAVRLGVGMGFIKDITIKELNRWLVLSLPGHLRINNDGDLEEREENILRANLIRKNPGRK